MVDSIIVAISPSRVDVPASSQGVRFGAQTPRAEADDKIELGHIFGPTGLTMGKDLGHGEVLKVLVIHDHVDWDTETFKVVPPTWKASKIARSSLS